MTYLTDVAQERVETGHPVEWWFVHGRLQGKGFRRRYFMVSLFRVRVPGARRGPKPDVFAALISVFDPASGRQRVASLIDRRILGEFAAAPASFKLDPFCPAPVLDELRSYGLPREFEMPDTEPELTPSPFSCRWGDLIFTVKGDCLKLTFPEPGGRLKFRLRLKPQSPRLAVISEGEADQSMRIATWPRMQLQGSAGSVPVHGEAWFDHQYGSELWFRTRDSAPRALGWDWIGFNLNDGSSWVVLRRWDAATRTESHRSLIVRQADGTVFRPKSFAWTPVRWWKSTATRAEYPVEWHLEVPDLDTCLDFLPYSDNQEIRVFGSIRAIWEGAGIMQGTSRGKTVAGEARLEGQGYGYILGARDYLSQWAGPVDEELARLLPRQSDSSHLAAVTRGAAAGYEPSAYGNMLARPLWDLMDRDGKRWRGIFACLMLEAFGADSSVYRSVLFAWPELLHNASLIIDDLQDGSPTRRGAETIHLRYGTDVAVGAANTAYFLSLFPVLNHPRLTAKQKLALCTIYQRLMLCAHLGQSQDIFWTRHLTEDCLRDWMRDSMACHIRQMYLLKTAGPVEGLAEVTALIAGAKKRTRDAAMAFARAFGLAYQMIDDINDFSAPPRWGKQRGEDLAGGKVTYLIFRALELLPARDRNRLRTILCRPDLRLSPDIREEGIRLVMRSGACEKVRREARNLVEAAWQEYSRWVPPSAPKTELRLLWEGLLDFR